MGFYNDDHPNGCYPQQRPRSAWGARLTGTVGVHDVESIADKVGADLGGENCANFIATRCDAGGYHELVDSDSFIPMTRDDWMTWHTAAASANGYAWGISAACRTVDWDINDEWTKKTIATMGARIRAFAERNGFPVDKIARWLTKEQAERREIGLYHHGVIQPADRSDAWVKHPQRAQLDQMLIVAILGGTNPEVEEVVDAKQEDAIAEKAANRLLDKLANPAADDTRVDAFASKVASKVDDRIGNGLAQDQGWKGVSPWSLRDLGRYVLANGPAQGADLPTAKDILERLVIKFGLTRDVKPGS